MKLFSYLKLIIMMLVILQFTPLVFKTLHKQYQELTTAKTRVGRVKIKGTLVSATHYIKTLKTFFEDKSIKAILLIMESRGGAAGTSQAVFEEIKALKQQHMKPVIAFVENVCASGAYYIACAADTIISTPSAFIGSIGVYIQSPELKEFLDQYKVKYNLIKTGTYKAAGNPFTHTTPEQTAMFQGLTDNTYQQFVQDVAQSRKNLNINNATQWAEGRIFTGNQARSLELVDKVGSLSVVEQEIKEKAPIVGKIAWVDAPEPSKFSEFLSELENKGFAGHAISAVAATLMGNKSVSNAPYAHL